MFTATTGGLLLNGIVHLVVTTVITFLTSCMEFLIGTVCVRIRFITSLNSIDTKRAIKYLSEHCCSSSELLMNGEQTRPNTWIVCWRPLCIAHVSTEIGQRKWGDDDSCDVVVFWPVWRVPPRELVPAFDPPEPMRAGAVTLKVLNKTTSGMDFTTWTREDETFNMDRCPTAAHDAARRMIESLECSDTHSKVFYVNGPPGSGKTSASMILAWMLNGYYIDSYDFIASKTRLNRVIHDCIPSRKAPVIVSVSEADCKITDVVLGKRVCGKKKNKRVVDTDVDTDRDAYDKGSLITLLDNINYRFENVVFVMSGNTPFTQLQAELIDPAFTRPGRIEVVNVGGDNTYDRCTPSATASCASPPISPSTPEKSDTDTDTDTDNDTDTDSNTESDSTR